MVVQETSVFWHSPIMTSSLAMITFILLGFPEPVTITFSVDKHTLICIRVYQCYLLLNPINKSTVLVMRKIYQRSTVSIIKCFRPWVVLAVISSSQAQDRYLISSTTRNVSLLTTSRANQIRPYMYFQGFLKQRTHVASNISTIMLLSLGISCVFMFGDSRFSGGDWETKFAWSFCMRNIT